jgi:DNA invertase Pin-like site-specific DNA recombinase
MIRAAIYARYSSKGQSKYSVEDQFRLGEDYAARNGMVVVGRFGDKARTGRMARKRDGFNQLCDAGREHGFDVVIIEGTDRVARNLRISAGFYDLMEHHGIVIHSLAGPVDSLVFKMSSLIAEQQSRDAAARTRGRQIERLKATGRVVAGLAFGYVEAPGEGPNSVIVEPEAGVVRRIYRDFANPTRSPAA